MWNCERTADLRSGLQAPADRLEERLLSKAVPETPALPVVLDYDDLVDELAAVCPGAPCFGGLQLLVATDGSVVDTVAAWAVVVDNEPRSFSLGVAAEDQSPHRAEVEGLLAVVRAFLRCTAAGRVHVLADCQSAMRMVQGGGKGAADCMLQQLKPRIDLKIWWSLPTGSWLRAGGPPPSPCPPPSPRSVPYPHSLSAFRCPPGALKNISRMTSYIL